VSYEITNRTRGTGWKKCGISSDNSNSEPSGIGLNINGGGLPSELKGWV